jgi:hypothetical protein
VNLHLGWRQNLGLGFHADAKINAGWGHIEDSAIDVHDCDSFDVELMAAAGWRVSCNGLHLLLQPAGFGYVAYKSDPWPIEGQGTPRTEGPFYVGNVIAGLGV